MPRREREQDPPVVACCGPRLKRVPLDNSLEKSSRPTPVPSELTRAVRGASVHDGLGRLKLLTPHATHDLRLEPVERDFMVGWQLGKGSFGTVFVALSRANRRDVRAVKVIDLGHADARTISKLAVEVRTMRRVDHPNICRLDDCYLHEKKFSMVIEYCSGGELFDRITAKDHYSEREARVAFAQMVEAVGHCHRHEVAHRDLKPENVLYAGPEGTRSAHVLKVCDFGLSTTFGGGHHDLHRKVGTPGYVGPEVLTATEERGYGPECDLWSLGVILYVMLSGTMPFYGRDKAEVYRNTCSGAYAVDGPEFAQISHDAVGLIHQLLVVDPARRLTPDGVFAHPWMAKDHVVNTIHLAHFSPNIKRYKLKRKLKAAVFAIIAEHRFLASIARANPARYATEAARVAKKHSSSVFSPLGELANANGDK